MISRVHVLVLILTSAFHQANASLDDERMPASRLERQSISEQDLVNLARQEAPQVLQNKASLSAAKFRRSVYDDNFQTSFDTSASYSDSSEKAIATVVPVFGPVNTYSTGLNKNFKQGLKANAYVFSDQRSTVDKFIDHATRNGVNLNLTMDLYKNFLGRTTKAEIKSLALKEQKAQLEYQIANRSFELDVRKIYWSLVANNESLQIAEKLLQTSKAQLKQARARAANNIADRGEVARYAAQVASREANIQQLKYQKYRLNEALKTYLPSLAGKEIVLSKYNLQTTLVEVLQCTGGIRANKEVPLDQTKYDDIVEILKKDYESTKLVTDQHDRVDVALTAEIQSSGVDNSYQAAFDDFSSDRGTSYGVGVTISIPLGSQKSETKEIKEKLEIEASLAERQALLARLNAQHEEITNLIMLLQQALDSQAENSKMLGVSLKETRKKYRQARVDVVSLIAEQDALQSSLLTEIDIKLNVVHLLLDYFKVYTESPCNFNLRKS